MATHKVLEFDAIGSVADFIAGSALVAGFVQMKSSTDWTIVTATQSATSYKPIGITTGSVASGATGVEVRDKGIVWMLCQEAMEVGNFVYPSSVKGRIIKTGAADASGNSVFAGGFGTVIKGAAASGLALVKLQVL
jgi:hypothetical protein